MKLSLHKKIYSAKSLSHDFHRRFLHIAAHIFMRQPQIYHAHISSYTHTHTHTHTNNHIYNHKRIRNYNLLTHTHTHTHTQRRLVRNSNVKILLAVSFRFFQIFPKSLFFDLIISVKRLYETSGRTIKYIKKTNIYLIILILFLSLSLYIYIYIHICYTGH